MKEVPHVRPHKVKEFKSPQSRFPHVPALPMRALIYGPSGSGKGVLLTSMILDIYKGCFSRIYIFSPSIHLDQTWKEVIRYVREDMGVDDKKEPCFFDTYDSDALAKIVEQQFKLAKHMKENGNGFVYNVLVIADDFAASPEFMRNSKLLSELYIRGRHAFISVITSVQKIASISPMIRTQATHTMTFRLRSFQDLELWLNENSAIFNKKVLMTMYHLATDPAYGFIYINLMETDKRKAFFSRFDAQLVPSSLQDARPQPGALPAAPPAGEGEAPGEGEY
jgi:hypothetical protein